MSMTMAEREALVEQLLEKAAKAVIRSARLGQVKHWGELYEEGYALGLWTAAFMLANVHGWDPFNTWRDYLIATTKKYG